MIRGGQGSDIHALVAGRRLIIGGVDIPHERGLLGSAEVSEPSVEKTRQRDIELEQGTAYATPAQAFVISTLHQTARLTIMSLILPIALVGLRPFGQTSTQCMMV